MNRGNVQSTTGINITKISIPIKASDIALPSTGKKRIVTAGVCVKNQKLKSFKAVKALLRKYYEQYPTKVFPLKRRLG